MSVKAAGLLVSLALMVPFAFADPAVASPAAQAETDAAPDATPTPSVTQPATPEETPVPSPTPSESVAPTPTPTPEATPKNSEDDNATDEQTDESADAVTPLAATTATVPSVGRAGGSSQYEVSVNASRAAFPGGASTVIVASALAPATGVVGAWSAGHVGAPLLYVQQSAVPSAVVAEIRRLAPETILVYGGDSVSESVVSQLRTLAGDVRRVGGASRFALSQTVLQSAGSFDRVYLAEGVDLVAAPLAAVAAAANDRGFLLVQKGKSAPDAGTLAALRAVGARNVVIVGGTSGIPSAYETALRGAGFSVERRVAKDRYLSSVQMAQDRTGTVQRVIASNPASPAGSALAASLAAASGQPLVYTVQLCMVDAVASYVRSRNVRVTAVGGLVWLNTPVVHNSSCTAERERSQSALNAAIRSTLSGYAGTYSVTVRQDGGLNAVTSVNGATLREPASMMKIYAAWAALTRIQAGRASFGTVLPSGVDLGSCIHVMIHASDNYCHTDIVHWIGIAEINRMIRAAGFSNTAYGSVPPGTSVLYAGNRTTTNDLVEMMDGLDSARVLSRRYADHLIGEMRSQIWRSRIASGIPPGVAQASKPGALWIASGLLQADTAIVYGKNTKYYLSIVGDNGPPQAALRAVSRTVYQHFHGSFGTAASYPVQQMATVRTTALRTSPGGSMAVVVGAGTPLQVHDANRVWYQVQYGSRKLWALVGDLRNR